MFPLPCSPPSSSALLLATAAAVVLVASSVASPVSREADIEAIEQPGRKEVSHSWKIKQF